MISTHPNNDLSLSVRKAESIGESKTMSESGWSKKEKRKRNSIFALKHRVLEDSIEEAAKEH
jgi:hypothetical protein